MGIESNSLEIRFVDEVHVQRPAVGLNVEYSKPKKVGETRRSDMFHLKGTHGGTTSAIQMGTADSIRFSFTLPE